MYAPYFVVHSFWTNFTQLRLCVLVSMKNAT